MGVNQFISCFMGACHPKYTLVNSVKYRYFGDFHRCWGNLVLENVDQYRPRQPLNPLWIRHFIYTQVQCMKHMFTTASSHQTQNVCMTFVHCWPNVADVGPTLYTCYTNVWCLVGCGLCSVLIMWINNMVAKLSGNA